MPEKFRDLFAPSVVGIAVCAFVMIVVMAVSFAMGGLCASGNAFAQHLCEVARSQWFIRMLKVGWYGSTLAMTLIGARLFIAAFSEDR